MADNSNIQDAVLVSQEGYENMVAELERLRTVERPAVAERLKEARAFGDISENAEYDAAKNEQAELEERINELEDKIRRAQIYEEGKASRGKVNIGSKVQLKEVESGREQEVTIVGSTEADPFKGKISNESPVGKAIIGHKAGEIVEVEIKERDTKINYEILGINKK